MIRSLCVAAACGLLGLGIDGAHGQGFPSRAINLVVPAAPGGVTDALGRLLAQRFSETWGQQAVVENKAGANNQIAAEYVAKSPPDGHTLLIGPEVTFTANPSLYPKLAYDPVKDFTPIVGLVIINHALVINPKLPARDVKELIAYAKAHPGELNYGTFGAGSTGHLNMELLRSLAGVELTAVHYKGATPALTDVVAGHIQMMYISVGSAVEPARGGLVRLVGVGADKRMVQLPDVPTVAESGLPGYRAVSWFGLFGAANTPRPIVDKINAEVRRIFADPAVRRDVLDPQFFEPIAGTPEQLSGFLGSEAEKFGKLIRAMNIKGE
jgi:tripartite-type tricarboxylate transporter receptor subunit TctC